jgi:hypothetical protein
MFMKKLNYLILLLALTWTSTLNAQQGPYVEPLYDVEVTTNQIYGVNATILPVLFQQTDEAIPQPLLMDIYEPVGDNNDCTPGHAGFPYRQLHTFSCRIMVLVEQKKILLL